MRFPRRALARDSLYPLLAGLAALAFFLPGINWGLPTRDDDRFLFGDRKPWTGNEIIELAGGLDTAGGRGADVDANPLDPSSGPVVLNDTDARRAEIVRRYRLFSHQPDEFINFAAIAGMAQRRDGDPRLYQYGGLWLYPIAGLLAAADVLGYLELRGDLAWYLDRPEEFGKFYVVARLYSAIWGAIGAGLVFLIVRRLTGGNFSALAAAMAFALLPAVVTAAHEAKPHLAGAALMLWAVLKADDYVARGRRGDAIWVGVLCGAASAMVVSMVVSFALLPVMGLLRWRRERIDAARARAPAPGVGRSTLDVGRSTFSGGPSAAQVEATANVERPTLNVERRSAGGWGWGAVALAFAVGVAIYAVTNPWVVYHVLFDREVFRSNISNSTAMYQARDIVGGIGHGALLLAIATGTLFAVALVTALLVFAARRSRLGARSWLLITAGGAVLAYFFALGAGKPPEYARFGIVPMTVLLIAYFAVAGRGLFPLPRHRRWLSVLGVVLVAFSGVPYIVNFVLDSGPTDTRTRAAERLERLREPGVRLSLTAEPAPWSSPPFDLWGWEAVLDKKHSRDLVNVHFTDTRSRHIGFVAGPFITPISWANKAFELHERAPSPASDRNDLPELEPLR